MFPPQSVSEAEITLPPAVVVHGLAHALAALAPGLAVTLLSAPGAGAFAGALWWRALVAQARAAHPATPCADILDCADAPGHAMAAIRAGQQTLVLDPACPAFPRIAALARVLPARPPALDLAAHGAARQLHAWLLQGPSDDSTAALR
jgi:hypothetical protein